jgi:hypothetical protein
MCERTDSQEDVKNLTRLTNLLSTFRDYANGPKRASVFVPQCTLLHTLRCTTDIFQVKVAVKLETYMLFHLILRRAEALRIY